MSEQSPSEDELRKQKRLSTIGFHIEDECYTFKHIWCDHACAFGCTGSVTDTFHCSHKVTWKNGMSEILSASRIANIFIERNIDVPEHFNQYIKLLK